MKVETYNLFIEVEKGLLTPEEAQIELLKLLDSSYESANDVFTGSQLDNVPFGLYEVYWKEGGSSLASIGNMHDGVRWIAPTNWTSEDNPTGRMDKLANKISRMIRIYK